MNFKIFIIISLVAFNVSYACRVDQTQKVYKKEYKKILNKANEYSLKGEIEKSLFYAKEAYKIKPSKEALLIMARIYNYKKEYENLKKTALKILDISPGNYLGNIYLANAYMKCDPLKAREILVSLLKKYPDDRTVLEKLKKVDKNGLNV